MVRDGLRAVALIAETAVALRRAGVLMQTQPGAIDPMMGARSGPVTAAETAIAAQVARAVARAARLVPRATCLVRAVAAYQLLERRGVRTTLCIGHRDSPSDGFTAHAWLELGGVAIVGEPSPSRFARPSG